ncbi:MAG: hypothetical protein PHE83_18885 [Opitutaceae bacterium]|nr:hypothetical protein [Opitutaceae bacterium]
MEARVLRAGVIPPAALLVGVTCLGVMMALMPANRLLTVLGLRRWRQHST